MATRMLTNSLAFEHGPRSNTYRVHEFDPTSYDWDDWEVLFNTYIDVEGVTDDTKKRNLLITALAVQPLKTLTVMHLLPSDQVRS